MDKYKFLESNSTNWIILKNDLVLTDFEGININGLPICLSTNFSYSAPGQNQTFSTGNSGNDGGYVFDGNNKTITINSINSNFNGLFNLLGINNSQRICIINLNVIVNCDMNNKAVFMNSATYNNLCFIVGCSVIVNKSVLAPFTNIGNSVRITNSYVIINAPTTHGFLVCTSAYSWGISRSYIIVNDNLQYLITETGKVFNNTCYNHCIINNISKLNDIVKFIDILDFTFYSTDPNNSFTNTNLIPANTNYNFVDKLTNISLNTNLDKFFGNFSYNNNSLTKTQNLTQYEITIDDRKYIFPGFLNNPINLTVINPNVTVKDSNKIVDYTYSKNSMYQFYLTLNYSSSNTIIDDKLMQQSALEYDYNIVRTSKIYLKNICTAADLYYNNNILSWRSTSSVIYKVTIENNSIVLKNNNIQVTEQTIINTFIDSIINNMAVNLILNDKMSDQLSVTVNSQSISDTPYKIMSLLSIYDPILKNGKNSDFLNYVLTNWSTISYSILKDGSDKNLSVILSDSLKNSTNQVKRNIVLNFVDFLYLTPQALIDSTSTNYPFNILLNCDFELKEFKNQTLKSQTKVLLSN